MGFKSMTKFNFHEQYKGPRGAHLDCLTLFSITRDESKRGGESIHPRVGTLGRAIHPKSNTCKAPSKSRRARVVASLRDYCEEHPNNRVAAAHLASLTAR